MTAQVATVAFLGLEARGVDVQVQIAPGLPAFVVVGLPDKAVTESRERVRAALTAIGLSLPPKRVVINLSPADLPKEGSHYDLPIAVGVLAAMGVLDREQLADYVVMGELALDGRISAAPGVLLAALHAAAAEKSLICPADQGGEAAWGGASGVVAAPSLFALIDHLRGTALLPAPTISEVHEAVTGPDLADIKGQEAAKRALELAAAGGHSLLMVGPPGSGKSLLAAALPRLLPALVAREALEASMVASVAGTLHGGRISRMRPFRSPHHSASMAALVGGGMKARPGEVSLAHQGVLFLDELPEFQRAVLDALRQPLETQTVTVARANAHVTYPAAFQLVAAMNPCRCGHLADASLACSRAPKCGADYTARLSGPLLDRFDVRIEVPAVSAADLTAPPAAETSADVAARILRARALQAARYGDSGPLVNARADGRVLEEVAAPDAEGRKLLLMAAEKLKLSARGYHRVLRVARTIADLAEVSTITRPHIAEALGYRTGGLVPA